MTRRFSATQATTIKDLQRTMKKMGATSLNLNQDIMGGNVDIIFDRNGKRYKFSCKRYEDSIDNLRAVQLSIEYLYRALESYGVFNSEEELERMFATFFIGFEATPDDTVLLLGESTNWWEILGVDRGCDKIALRNAFKSLARIHHTDVGGDKEMFVKIRKAYEEGLKEME